MTKAASVEALQELHGKIAKALVQRLDQDMEDNIPTDAATLGVATKFLKDNNISADPATGDDLDLLRKKLADQSAARKGGLRDALDAAKGDLTLQ